jgi:hypothetical protein
MEISFVKMDEYKRISTGSHRVINREKTISLRGAGAI